MKTNQALNYKTIFFIYKSIIFVKLRFLATYYLFFYIYKIYSLDQNCIKSASKSESELNFKKSQKITLKQLQ